VRERITQRITSEHLRGLKLNKKTFVGTAREIKVSK
jgi:hypothetical protein